MGVLHYGWKMCFVRSLWLWPQPPKSNQFTPQSSLKKFTQGILRCHVHKSGMDVRSQRRWPLTYDDQNQIGSSVSLSGHLWKVWRNSLVWMNEMTGQHNASRHDFRFHGRIRKYLSRFFKTCQLQRSFSRHSLMCTQKSLTCKQSHDPSQTYPRLR